MVLRPQRNISSLLYFFSRSLRARETCQVLLYLQSIIQKCIAPPFAGVFSPGFLSFRSSPSIHYCTAQFSPLLHSSLSCSSSPVRCALPTSLASPPWQSLTVSLNIVEGCWLSPARDPTKWFGPLNPSVNCPRLPFVRRLRGSGKKTSNEISQDLIPPFSPIGTVHVTSGRSNVAPRIGPGGDQGPTTAHRLW